MANLKNDHQLDVSRRKLKAVEKELASMQDAYEVISLNEFADQIRSEIEKYLSKIDWWAWLIAVGAFAVFAYFGWGLLT